jgi:hypothetical protein
MNIGDLVRCWDHEGYNRIGILLMHDKALKTVTVCFQDTGEIRTLASRDIELYKRSPENLKKIKKTLDSDA